MEKFLSKSEAMEIISKIKINNGTAYFSGIINLKDMFNMLHEEMYFGIDETNLIIAALVNIGAKFKIGDSSCLK